MKVRREFTHRTVIELEDDTWRETWVGPARDASVEVEVVAVQQRWYTTKDSTLPPGQIQAIGLRVKQDGSLGRTRTTRSLSPAEVEALPAHVRRQLAEAWPRVVLPLHRTVDQVDPDVGEHHGVDDRIVTVDRDRLAEAIVYHAALQKGDGKCRAGCDVRLGTSLAQHAIDVALGEA